MNENESKSLVNLETRWNNIPAVLEVNTIVKDLGWPLTRYALYQDNFRRELLARVPDVKGKFYRDELLLHWMPLYYSGPTNVNWDIILTNKRIVWKYCEQKLSWGVLQNSRLEWGQIFYKNIVDIQPEWRGDLGSHIEGGGGYVSGWVWNGWGNTWGEQMPVQTIKHHIECFVNVNGKGGFKQRFPILNIFTQGYLDETKNFINRLKNLVNLAWNQGPAPTGTGAHHLDMAEQDAAIKLDPNNAAAYYSRGYAHAKEGEYDPALDDLDMAIRLVPNSALFYCVRGKVRLWKEQYDKAIVDFSQAIRFNKFEPQGDNKLYIYIYVEAYKNRASAYFKKEQWNRAIDDYGKVIKYQPDSTLLEARAAAFDKKGQQKKAAADREMAKNLPKTKVTGQ